MTEERREPGASHLPREMSHASLLSKQLRLSLPTTKMSRLQWPLGYWVNRPKRAGGGGGGGYLLQAGSQEIVDQDALDQLIVAVSLRRGARDLERKPEEQNGHFLKIH